MTDRLVVDAFVLGTAGGLAGNFVHGGVGREILVLMGILQGMPRAVYSRNLGPIAIATIM